MDYMVQIIAQAHLTHPIVPKFEEFKVPGRTTKALKHQWTKIREEIASLSPNFAHPGGSSKKAAPKKRARKTKADEEDEGKPDKKPRGYRVPKKAKKEITPEHDPKSEEDLSAEGQSEDELDKEIMKSIEHAEPEEDESFNTGEEEV